MQDKDESGSLVLIATDGTQHPPLHFPPGGHLVMFLQCVEASLTAAHAHFEPTVDAAIAKKEREAEEARERERKASSEAGKEGDKEAEEGKKEEAVKPSRRFLPLLRLKRREVSAKAIALE